MSNMNVRDSAQERPALSGEIVRVDEGAPRTELELIQLLASVAHQGSEPAGE